MSDAVRNFGILLVGWSVLAFLFNPFLENERWRKIAIGLFAAGSLLFTIGISFPASADTHPKDGDVKQAPLVSGAAPEGGDAQP